MKLWNIAKNKNYNKLSSFQYKELGERGRKKLQEELISREIAALKQIHLASNIINREGWREWSRQRRRKSRVEKYFSRRREKRRPAIFFFPTPTFLVPVPPALTRAFFLYYFSAALFCHPLNPPTLICLFYLTHSQEKLLSSCRGECVRTTQEQWHWIGVSPMSNRFIPLVGIKARPIINGDR